MISRKNVTGAKRINNKNANTFESLIKNFSKVFIDNNLPLILKWTLILSLIVPAVLSILAVLKLISSNTHYEFEFKIKLKASNTKEDNLNEELKKLLEKSGREEKDGR